MVAVLCFLIAVTQAPLHASHIGLWSEWSSTLRCSFQSDPPGLLALYVVHHAPVQAAGSRFRLEPSADLTMVYQSETLHLGYAQGNLRDGVEIHYGTCLQGDYLVATVIYLADGNSAPCSYVTVAPHPDVASGEPEVWNCAEGWVPDGFVTKIYVVKGGNCPGWCFASPTENTTWGAIKALYQ